MKVLFLQKDIFAKGGIMALSAMLKRQGHQCELLINDLETNIVSKTIDADPDVIAFSITTGEFLWMRQIGARIREHCNKPIICGGPHPTFYPELIAEEYLDAICIGEGDEAFLEFLCTLEKGEDITHVQNFIVKKNGKIFKNALLPLIQDLDSLPFWDREIYKKYKLYRHAPGNITLHDGIMTGRGCPYQCSFCFNKAYNRLYQNKGKIVRRRSTQNVIEELLQLKNSENPKFIPFLDDSFTLPPVEWLFDFLEQYEIHIQIPFWIITRADLLLNASLMAKLKKANCYSFKMGVECGNENFRKNVIQKKVSNRAIIEAAHLAKKYGIRIHTFNMAGCPGETLDMVFETFAFNKKIRPDFLWCSLLYPYPRTDIFDRAVENHAIDASSDFHTFDHTYFMNIPIRTPRKSEIARLQKLMYMGLLLHLPNRAMSLLIKLPLGKIYSLMFGFTYFIGLYKVNKVGFFKLFRLSVGRLAKYTR